MPRRRDLYSPREATNEGSRQLRELARKQSFGQLARRLRCDESSVRRWASEDGKPNLQMRARCNDVIGIRDEAWDEPPDVYVSGDPETQRPPS